MEGRRERRKEWVRGGGQEEGARKRGGLCRGWIRRRKSGGVCSCICKCTKLGLAYANICMQELGLAYVLAYLRSRCMAFLHGTCMVLARYLHGICMVLHGFAWFCMVFAWYLHGSCMCIFKSHANTKNRLDLNHYSQVGFGGM